MNIITKIDYRKIKMINNKNKKSQLGLITAIVIASLFITIIIFFLNNYKTGSNEIIDDSNCKNALELSIITQNNDISECKINTIQINDKKLKQTDVSNYINLHKNLKDEYGNYYFEKDDIQSNIFKINKIIADEMVRIWEIVDEGLLNPFDKTSNMEDSNSKKYCLVASSIYFNEKNFEGSNEIIIPLALKNDLSSFELEKNSLFYYLLYNNYKPTSNLSYFDFLTDVDSDLQNYANVILPIIENNKITTNNTYYIIYRKTYFKEISLKDSLFSAIAGTMIFSELKGIANTVAKGVTTFLSASQAIESTKDTLLEKGFDNIILIDNSSYIANLYQDEKICDVFINLD